MSALLKVVDEHFGSGGAERRPGPDLRLVSQRTTAREIIRQRVEAEVEVLNERRSPAAATKTRSFLVSVETGSAEAILNPLLAPRSSRRLQAEPELVKALAGFEAQRFIMLFNDRQVEGLDDALIVTPESQVVFLYLTPLKGG